MVAFVYSNEVPENGSNGGHWSFGAWDGDFGKDDDRMGAAEVGDVGICYHAGRILKTGEQDTSGQDVVSEESSDSEIKS